MLNNLFRRRLLILMILHESRWVVLFCKSCGCRTHFWDFLFLFLRSLFIFLLLFRTVFFRFFVSGLLGVWGMVGVNFVFILTVLTIILLSFNFIWLLVFNGLLLFLLILVFTVPIRLFRCSICVSNLLFYNWLEINIRYQIWWFFNGLFHLECLLFNKWLFFTLKVILNPLAQVVWTVLLHNCEHQ